MSNLSPLASHVRDLWNRATVDPPDGGPTPTVAPSASPSARPATASDVTYDAVEHLPTPSVALATLVGRMDPVGAKLDQLQDAASGPYTVNGASVRSGAQFRMNGGYNDAAAKDPAVSAILTKAAARAGVSGELGLLRVGRGRPEALVKLTQALIDDGQLPAGGAEPLAAQIHRLQWRMGIGLDCAGYVYRAVAATSGDPSKLGLATAANENFAGLASNRHFQRVDAGAARAGDVVVLAGSGKPTDPGHNLVVRSCSSVTTESVREQWPEAAEFVRGRSVVRMLEVDSAFSAGANGRPDGGVRRDVVLFTDEPRTWCTIRMTDPRSVVSGAVPYSEGALTGIFRAKVTP